ncbi:hypothetical protein [Acinetobacter beijerinckii]|uniref:Bbp19 family protein n=1 Tax=Acinetobacter beijerinckii TaxID=262668 RepID=UPI003AF60D37
MSKKSIYEQEIEQANADLAQVLETEQGRRVLMRLINRASVMQPTYANGTHPSDFAFMEGRREMGLFLIGSITEINSDIWLEMQKEDFKNIKLKNEQVKHERAKQRTIDNE